MLIKLRVDTFLPSFILWLLIPVLILGLPAPWALSFSMLSFRGAVLIITHSVFAYKWGLSQWVLRTSPISFLYTPLPISQPLATFCDPVPTPTQGFSLAKPFILSSGVVPQPGLPSACGQRSLSHVQVNSAGNLRAGQKAKRAAYSWSSRSF